MESPVADRRQDMIRHTDLNRETPRLGVGGGHCQFAGIFAWLRIFRDRHSDPDRLHPSGRDAGIFIYVKDVGDLYLAPFCLVLTVTALREPRCVQQVRSDKTHELKRDVLRRNGFFPIP